MSLRIESNYEASQIYYSGARAPEVMISVFGQGDNMVNSSQTAHERYKAMQVDEKQKFGRLVYHKETVKQSYLLGIIKLPPNVEHAYYEYTCNGKETVYQIKKRFGIKEGALKVFNRSYDDTNPATKEDVEQCVPSAGTKLRFYEYDVE